MCSLRRKEETIEQGAGMPSPLSKAPAHPLSGEPPEVPFPDAEIRRDASRAWWIDGIDRTPIGPFRSEEAAMTLRDHLVRRAEELFPSRAALRRRFADGPVAWIVAGRPDGTCFVIQAGTRFPQPDLGPFSLDEGTKVATRKALEGLC